MRDKLIQRFPSVVILPDETGWCEDPSNECFAISTETGATDSLGFPLVSAWVGNSDEFDSFLRTNGYWSSHINGAVCLIMKED